MPRFYARMFPDLFKAFFSIFGGGAQHAAKNWKKCQVVRLNVRRNFQNSAEISKIPPVRLLVRLE